MDVILSETCSSSIQTELNLTVSYEILLGILQAGVPLLTPMEVFDVLSQNLLVGLPLVLASPSDAGLTPLGHGHVMTLANSSW